MICGYTHLVSVPASETTNMADPLRSVANQVMTFQGDLVGDATSQQGDCRGSESSPMMDDLTVRRRLLRELCFQFIDRVTDNPVVRARLLHTGCKLCRKPFDILAVDVLVIMQLKIQQSKVFELFVPQIQCIDEFWTFLVCHRDASIVLTMQKTVEILQFSLFVVDVAVIMQRQVHR